MDNSADRINSTWNDSTFADEELNNSRSGCTFLTNHAHVLLCLYRQPHLRLREVAVLVGITERMVQRVVVDLIRSDYLKIVKEGRRNRYVLNSGRRLRHPLERQHTVGKVMEVLNQNDARDSEISFFQN